MIEITGEIEHRMKQNTRNKSCEGALYKMIMIWEGWGGGDEFDN